VKLLWAILGIATLAALDSTPFFYLPLGIDGAIVAASSQHPSLAWIYGIVAVGASLGGAWVTFFLGARIGEPGLDRIVSGRRLRKVKRRVARRGAVLLAISDLIPPPFPFTLSILTAGALSVNRNRFFGTLGLVRILRFGSESMLGAAYGVQIFRWTQYEWLRRSAWILVIAGFLAGLVSAGRFVRKKERGVA
jgi:membrane protein YqaA with SNARE-associated domain